MKALLLALVLLAGCAGDKVRPFFKVGHGQHARSHVVDWEVGAYWYHGVSKWGLGWTPTMTASNHTDPMIGMPYPLSFSLTWEMQK